MPADVMNKVSPGRDAPTEDPTDFPVEVTVKGPQMKAFLVAYASFKDDPLIPEQKKLIENYRIEFRKHGENYYVLFSAIRKPSESELDGGESELGKDVMYTISMRDFRLVDRKFFK
jgi:hypothetical protein